MPSHGVARTSTWQLSEEEPPAEDGHVKVGQTPLVRGFVVDVHGRLAQRFTDQCESEKSDRTMGLTLDTGDHRITLPRWNCVH